MSDLKEEPAYTPKQIWENQYETIIRYENANHAEAMRSRLLTVALPDKFRVGEFATIQRISNRLIIKWIHRDA